MWNRLYRSKTLSRQSAESPIPDDSFFSLASTSKLSLVGLDGEFSRSAWTLPGCDDMEPDEKREWVRALREADNGYPHLKCSRSSIIQKPNATFQSPPFSAVTPRSRCLIDEARIFGGADTSGVGSSDPPIDFEPRAHSPMLGCDMAAGPEEQRAWIRQMHLASVTWEEGLALRTSRPRAPSPTAA